MKTRYILPAIALAAVISCGSNHNRRESMDRLASRVFETAKAQVVLMDSLLEADRCPRTLDSLGKLVTTDIGWWCSGFYPGVLWQVYDYTRDTAIMNLARTHTFRLYDLESRNTDHDIGFQVMSSFYRGYLSTRDENFLPMVRQSAKRLSGRFSPVTGTIRSWNGDIWKWPVIIDNMMNLELLTTVSRLGGGEEGDSLMKVAVTHANTTMKNHFRDDFTTFHLVDYDPSDGHVIKRQTVQGYADSSAWARGQAWALYGYTMMARETGSLKDESISRTYLSQAENIAKMLLYRLPDDGIPYWDFDDPAIPSAPKDASAGAVMASAFIELSRYTSDKTLKASCLDMAQKQIRTLASEEYLSKKGENEGFILRHSVGNLPDGSEVDVPLTYADYYFLEAISRWQELHRKRK